MTDYTVCKDWPDTISFDRLHALAKRGYRAILGVDRDDSGFSRIELQHPKVKGTFVPPEITLWSNGIVATRGLLWPSRHVPQEDGLAPDWQKFIDVSDESAFRSFVDSIPLPTMRDLYLRPFMTKAQKFTARLVFAATICLCLAGALVLVSRMLGG